MTGVGSRPVVLCFGTRPQVIKASVLLLALRARLPTIAVDTGQHYDYELNALLYEQLSIARPDHCLEVGSGSHAEQTASILTRAEPLLQQWQPRAVAVIGDTNSTLGCALAAAKLRVPVVHVEAGMRASDSLLAEEINRRAVDVMSSLLCAPSQRIAERLEREQLPGRIVVTGDIARDVLIRSLSTLPSAADAVPGVLKTGMAFVFATLHRAELTDNPTLLGNVLNSLDSLGMPVILPLHPRTRKAVEGSRLDAHLSERIHLLPPLGYLESLACVREAAIVITDSGGVQREAYWLGTPCVTLRAETEWEETVRCGANLMLSPEAAGHLAEVATAQSRRERDWDRDLLGVGNAAERIADAVTASPAWGNEEPR